MLDTISNERAIDSFKIRMFFHDFFNRKAHHESFIHFSLYHSLFCSPSSSGSNFLFLYKSFYVILDRVDVGMLLVCGLFIMINVIVHHSC